MPQCSDAKLFQVLSREARQDPLVNLILAEDCLVLLKAQAPQPDHNVHDGAQSGVANHGPAPRGYLADKLHVTGLASLRVGALAAGWQRAARQCAGVAEQEAAVRRGQRVAAEAHRAEYAEG
jgi:hypothetical protein